MVHVARGRALGTGVGGRVEDVVARIGNVIFLCGASGRNVCRDEYACA